LDSVRNAWQCSRARIASTRRTAALAEALRTLGEITDDLAGVTVE